ncbi:hypothetical protein BD408DRAFT_355156 [Parasitella parasitica]|nr:hypothetical protein BD408DRAFT_355156 [Parasitella parasitica]
MVLQKEKIKVPRSLRSAPLSVVKNQISTPVIQTSTNSPKKVIKALYDYNAQSPNELSFSKGDFFLVTSHEGDINFYEAFNPMTNSRGIVPAPYFQVLEKHERVMVDSTQKNNQRSQQVLYDFQAERADELDAKAGEPIIIIAQSNAEWFVAKPIGRLGGPGLIPVSFVDIRDASTGLTVTNDLMQAPSSSVFPNVEDWKKRTQVYEASSISIGRMEKQMQQVSIEEEEATHDDGSIVISAYIDSHILEGDQYWFIVFARLANGKYRILYRLYEDFYDFQINFLQEFPAEGGKRDQTRILPYMPGPLDAVNEDITADRARDLSKYCDDLLQLPKYLSESSWVQEQLFGIHEGDIETDVDPGQQQQAVPIAANNNNTIKVKIIYQDEIFAIKVRVPSSVEFLRGKVVDRLGFDVHLNIRYYLPQYTIIIYFYNFYYYLQTIFILCMNDSDDFEPTATSGYKPGEKKTIEELQTLDAEDESLNKWKKALIKEKNSAANDPLKVIVENIALEVEGRPDVVVNLSTKSKIENDVVSGLKYLQVVKRKGIKVDKTEEMLGSYGPNTEAYEKKFQPEEAPSGMLARGDYTVKSKFVDDDKNIHMEWEWGFQIKKDWK